MKEGEKLKKCKFCDQSPFVSTTADGAKIGCLDSKCKNYWIDDKPKKPNRADRAWQSKN